MSELSPNFIYDIIEKDIKEGFQKQIHTRFPPEPNGYLHIGSAKAIWINYSSSMKFNGLFNLRYDDTNPAREEEEFVRSIEEDLRWLGAIPNGGIFYGSDYFDQCYEFARKLIKEGKAFVCDLSQGEMREYRGTLTRPGKPSPWRERDIQENLDIFEQMKCGKFPEGAKTLRAKIDMSAANMNMRDPALYRIVYAKHHRQGSAWCIYPLYDYAHPIQDALEGITHSLCSIEFENHRPLYDWVVDNIGFEQKPHQYEFARLNLTHTVMSKRYLRELVETKKVSGWDDPRMPTLCALRRRGYTPSSIIEFVKRSGVAKAYSTVDIRLLEYCIREELNQNAMRKVVVTEPLMITITNYPEDKEEYFELSNNPTNPSSIKRKVPFSSEIYIEKSDFEIQPPPKFHRLRPGGEVRLMGSYIIKCNEVILGDNGEIVKLLCTCDLETSNNKPEDGRKIKGTVHWLSAKHSLDTNINLYENLFTLENVKDVPQESSYLEFLNPNSLKELKNCKMESSLEAAKAGDSFQFVRMGYFCKDSKSENTYNRIVQLKDSFKVE